MTPIFIPSAVVLMTALMLIAEAPALAQENATPLAPQLKRSKEIGWSVKKSLLGRTVYNENNERIGLITDLLIGPTGAISHMVVAAGGYVGKGRHDVAIDMASVEVRAGRFYVEGASRDNIRATPIFEYASRL